MQDEVNEKVVALVIRMGSKGAHMTTSALKDAMRKYLQAQEKQKTRIREQRIQEKAERKAAKENPSGKQTLEQLMKKGQGLTNIEITDQNIKSFQRVANKYGIDYALKKDSYSDKPRYLVFFKAKDVDVMTAAFKEFSAKELLKSRKPSVQRKLKRAQEKAQKRQQKQREKVKQKDRGQDR